MTLLPLIVVGAMYAAFLVLGWLGARRARASDLILGGRSLPLWLAALTMTATWVDGGYLLGTAEGAFKASPASGWQGGVFFGLSLVVGGVFFAGRMRARGYTTLIDPFAERFGRGWAAVLAVPAVMAEIFWSAELLVAIGASAGAMMGVRLETAVLASAVIVVAYTMAGGLWSVAYADVLQLTLVVVGMALAIPFALSAAGGLGEAWEHYRAAFPERGGLGPPLAAHGPQWTPAAVLSWWDVSLMLLLGGVPWNCYFQRVLACSSPARARLTSVLAGVMTIVLVAPPLVLGLVAGTYQWTGEMRATLEASPAQALPLLLVSATPWWVALLGFGAIIGAVTSSFSASVLSAASMGVWNGLRAVTGATRERSVPGLMRGAILAVGVVAVLLALRAQSVQALWYFTSDLVFVLLFPQLIAALYDSRANLAGSVTAFCVSLVLRLGGGEPLLGLAPFIPYPELASRVVSLDPLQWYDADGAMLWPVRTVAACAGLVLLPLVSRLTTRHRPRSARLEHPA